MAVGRKEKELAWGRGGFESLRKNGLAGKRVDSRSKSAETRKRTEVTCNNLVKSFLQSCVCWYCLNILLGEQFIVLLVMIYVKLAGLYVCVSELV